MRGVKWSTRTFKQAIINGSDPDEATVKGDSKTLDGRFSPENVIGVEQFVYDEDYGYAGQYDLLYYYIDEEGNRRNVLADVKTSSAVRFDHKLQSAAYKRAVESSEWGPDTIHECEILRLYPDKEVVEVSRSPQWDRTLDGLAHEFLGLCDKAINAVLSETIATAHAELMDEQTTTDIDDGQLTVHGLT